MNINAFTIALTTFYVISAPLIQAAEDEPTYNVKTAFAQAQEAAQNDDYDKGLTILSEALSHSTGTDYLRNLHMQTDMNRILKRWEKVPTLVDQFMFHFTKNEKLKQTAKTWAAHRLAEKYAAQSALGQPSKAVQSSEQALEWYDDLSETWSVNADGAWVSKKTGQICSMVWKGHIRYDAYDEDNGDTSCQYWDSDLFGGVSLRIYKTSLKNTESAIGHIFEQINLAAEKSQMPQKVSAFEGDSAVLDSLSEELLVKGYQIESPFPTKGLVLASSTGGWVLNISYAVDKKGWAVRSLKLLAPDLH